jgi:hypothetical protein
MAKTAKIKIGDKVRIKNRKDWPTPPGYRFANAEGTVTKWVEWDETMADFQDHALVRLKKIKDKEYIGKSELFRVADLEKI